MSVYDFTTFDVPDLTKKIFKPQAARQQLYSEEFANKTLKYKFDEYSIGYCRHMGMGHNLYVLVKNEDNSTLIKEVCRKRINPHLMATQLGDKFEYRLIMIDYEIGGMSVYCSEDYPVKL